jgi:hypothetical protein
VSALPPIYPYLVGVLATVIVPVVALIMYVVSYRRYLELDRQQQRLPLATRFEDLGLRVQDLEVQRDELQADLFESKQIIEDAGRERDWMEQHRDEILQMREEQKKLAEHRLQYDELITKLADANESLEKAVRDISQADFQLELLQQKIAAEEDRLKGLADQVQSATDRLAATVSNLETTQAALDDARQSKAQAEEAAGKAEWERAILHTEVEALRREKKDLEKRLTEIRKQKGAAANEAAASRRESANFDADIKFNKEYLKELRAAQRGIDKQHTPEESLAELWQPVLPVSVFETASGNDDEREAIENVRNHLRNLGLRFPNRVIDAFHTSLKVAADSPLLVLAGISGTGKSLLPKRYAEAMGIHFLPVPVQPRWDGPQDLIGFFNYLENRYKATEMLRALIEMDKHCAGWAPEGYDGHAHDQMLIVLLDEMNLARVEYYFSDFLSRLETRRDINPDDPVDRAKASLRLDIGDMKGGKPPLVFVGDNVMFVGTMNEDESKMTLSDMVVDRAGIIRFGRPRGLATDDGPRDDETVDETSYRASAYCSRETWRKWIQKGIKENTLPNDIHDRIERLNKSLAHIGRPFGHRIHNAIVAYVRQYPDQSDAGQNYAFADQIEQRILPKLRGLDVSEPTAQTAINDIRTLVDELDDKELAKAIERATPEFGGHLFMWMGVDRDDGNHA